MSTPGTAFGKLLRAGDRHRQSRFPIGKGGRAPGVALLNTVFVNGGLLQQRAPQRS